MFASLGDLLPAALGVALSPIPIIGVVLILASPKARANGLTFALGWVIGLTSLSFLVVLVASGPADDGSAILDAGKLLLGVVLLAVGWRKWTSRPRSGEAVPMPAWMASIDSLGPTGALGLGLALSAANPKNLALTAAAATAVAESGSATGGKVAAVLLFVALASATVLGAVVAHLVAPVRSAKPLAAVQQAMTDHATVIMTVVVVLIGAKLVGDGLGGLLG